MNKFRIPQGSSEPIEPTKYGGTEDILCVVCEQNAPAVAEIISCRWDCDLATEEKMTKASAQNEALRKRIGAHRSELLDINIKGTQLVIFCEANGRLTKGDQLNRLNILGFEVFGAFLILLEGRGTTEAWSGFPSGAAASVVCDLMD